MFYRTIKRAFDFISSLLAVCVSSPLWLIIAIGIKTSSPGPVFYRANRAGLHGEPFTLYKFRSMHEVDSTADAKGKKKEGTFIANEDRIFPFGGFLRKSKLDELPQLLNILRGEMSVVGPRPLSPAGIKLYYTGQYSCITEVQPGLACLDSLFDYAHGELFVADNTEYKAKVLPVRTELAKLYTENRNAGMDVGIIFRTISLMYQIAIQKKREFPLTTWEQRATESVFPAQVSAVNLEDVGLPV